MAEEDEFPSGPVGSVSHIDNDESARPKVGLEIEHAGRAELFDDRQVDVEVAAVGVEQVVDTGDPGIVELIRAHDAVEGNSRGRESP